MQEQDDQKFYSLCALTFKKTYTMLQNTIAICNILAVFVSYVPVSL